MWQVQTITAVPFAVPLSLTSRQSEGNRTLPMVPLALKVHCWLVPPLQSQICARVPLVAFVGISRHLPSTWRDWPDWVNCWLGSVWQSQISMPVPLAVLLLSRSRQRPLDSLRSRKVVVGGGVLVPPPLTR
ncbi:hypothetical protein GCM10027615_28850 [Plantactinospora veratri]